MEWFITINHNEEKQEYKVFFCNQLIEVCRTSQTAENTKQIILKTLRVWERKNQMKNK